MNVNNAEFLGLSVKDLGGIKIHNMIGCTVMINGLSKINDFI